jgi:hypothetical protein
MQTELYCTTLRIRICILILLISLVEGVQVRVYAQSPQELTWNLHDHLYEILPPFALNGAPNGGNLSYVWRLSLGGWADNNTPAFDITSNAWGMVVQADRFNQWESNHWGIANLEIVDKDPGTLVNQVLIHPDWDNATVLIIPINSGKLTGYVVSDFSINVALSDESFNQSRSTHTEGVLLTVQALNVSPGSTDPILVNHELIDTKYWKDIRDLAGWSKFNQWMSMLSGQVGQHAIEVKVAKNSTPYWNHLEMILNLKLARVQVSLTYAGGAAISSVMFAIPAEYERRHKRREIVGGLFIFLSSLAASVAVLFLTLNIRWLDIGTVESNWLTYLTSLSALAGVLTNWAVGALYRDTAKANSHGK